MEIWGATIQTGKAMAKFVGFDIFSWPFTSIHGIGKGAAHGVPGDRGKQWPLSGELLQQQRQPGFIVLRHALRHETGHAHQLNKHKSRLNYQFNIYSYMRLFLVSTIYLNNKFSHSILHNVVTIKKCLFTKCTLNWFFF